MNAFQMQMNDIPVPDDLDSFIKKSMKKYSVRKINKRVFICLTAVVSLFAALTITCYASPKAAEALSKMPVIGSMFNRFTDKDLIVAHNNGLTQVLNQQQSDGDVTVTITELYCDQTDFSVSLTLENAKPGQFHYEVHYQNKLISGSYGGSIIEYKDDSYSQLENMPLNMALPDKCNIQFLAIEQEGLKREFIFNIAVDTSVANEQITEKEINKTYTEGERTLLVKKIVFSPYATTVYYNYTYPNDVGYTAQLLDNHKKALRLKSETNSTSNHNEYRTESGIAVFESMKKIPNTLTLNILKFDKDPTDTPVLLSAEIPLDTD